MKVTVLSGTLQKALSHVIKAVSTRTQLPILSHVLIDAHDDKIKLRATDLEIGVEIDVPATVEQAGATAVPAKLFADLINTLGEEKITLFISQEESRTLHVNGKHSSSRIQTATASEFPLLYEEKGEMVGTFSAESCLLLSERVVFASSIESTRPALSGVLFKTAQEGGVVCVATDGYRLSLQTIQNGVSMKQSEQALIIPARFVREMSMFKSTSTLSMYFSSANNQLILEQDGILLIGRSIDAQFPPYESIIPQESASVVVFSRTEALKAVRACALFAKESGSTVTFSLTENGMGISAKTQALGEHSVRIDGELKGEENSIVFNTRYVLDVLSHLSGEEISLSMSGPLNAGVFRIPKDPSFLHLIMPIRT
jgi:DNA polymerase-3 subunit beta